MGRKRTKNKHLPERVYFEHGQHWYRPKNGERIALGANLSAALMEYAKHVDRPVNLSTMNKLFDRYIQEKIPALAVDTGKSYLRAIGILRPVFGEMDPCDIRPTHIYGYLDARTEGGKLKARSANLEKSVLGSVFNSAIMWGVIDRNPCKEVRRVKQKNRERAPTRAEIDALCSVSPDLIIFWCAWKVATGKRQGQLLNLKWSDIKMDGIHFKGSKGGKDTVIEWTDELDRLVTDTKALRRKVGSIYVFCTRDGQPYTADGFRSIWQRAMKKAVSAGVLDESFTEHDIRVTSANEAKAAGLDPQEILAHRKRTTTDIYLRQKGPVRTKPVPLKKI